MHRRIFRKYYSAFAVLVAITVLTLGLVSATIIGVNSFYDRSESMERAAQKIAGSVASMPKNFHIIAGNIFDSSISAIKETIESDIVVLDKNGTINISTIETQTGTEFTESGIADYVLAGNIYRGSRYILGSKQLSGYTVGVPVISGDNNIGGAVFVTTYKNNIGSVMVGTMVIFMSCGIVALMIAFVVLFFITKSITKPIYQMSAIAHSYAEGDFSKRLDVKHSHEFAPLASAFNAMADGVDNLEQMRRGFIADVSHELRTPMTTITGFVDGMLDGTIPPDQYDKYLTIVSEEIKRVSRMVNSFLDIAKMQSGQMSYVKAPFDIVKTVGKALFAFEEKINNKNITLIDDFCNDSVIVRGDEDSIYRVVYNLMDNAVKFTDIGGEIKCGVQIQDKKAMIYVRNTGLGISKEEAPHIFERFYKSDKSRSINKRGTGIGLYLVKNILKGHGEDIILSSVEGEYVQFVFTLPLDSEYTY